MSVNPVLLANQNNQTLLFTHNKDKEKVFSCVWLSEYIHIMLKPY